MSRYLLFSFALSLAIITSCQYLKRDDDLGEGEPVARVYDSYLYDRDLNAIVPESLSGNDSIAFVQNYINVWAKNKLMVYKAEFNLSEEQKHFEKKIRDYRNDLLKHAYLEKYVEERLDTNISERDIREYYNENKENFSLRENIVKVRYIAIPVEAPKKEEIIRLFESSDPEDLEQLEDYALRYARFLSLRDSSWISFTDFSEVIPVQTFNQMKFLEENKFIEIEQDEILYLADIQDYKIKNTQSPLPYVRKLIKNILINKKRLALIEKLEKSLLNDALDKKEFETY